MLGLALSKSESVMISEDQPSTYCALADLDIMNDLGLVGFTRVARDVTGIDHRHDVWLSPLQVSYGRP